MVSAQMPTSPCGIAARSTRFCCSCGLVTFGSPGDHITPIWPDLDNSCRSRQIRSAVPGSRPGLSSAHESKPERAPVKLAADFGAVVSTDPRRGRLLTRESVTERSMKRVFAILVVAVVGTSGCAASHHHPHYRPPPAKVVVAAPPARAQVIIVRQAPPPPKVVRTRPRKPVGHAVWIAGHWHWTGHRYVWRKGFWEVNPKGSWVSGHWEKRRGGWVWIPGHWS